MVDNLPMKAMYRPDEVAFQLGLSRRQIYLWIQRQRIKAQRFGTSVRISREEFDRLLREGV